MLTGNYREKGHYIVGVIVSALLMVIILSPDLSRKTSAVLQQNTIYHSNKAYLRQSEKADRKNLLLLAEIRGLLYVLQSSDVGVSFIVDANISVGQVLAPLVGVSDKSFEVTLASATATLALTWLLELCEFFSPYIALVLVIMFGVYCLMRIMGKASSNSVLRPTMQRFLKMTFLLFLSSHLLIPYSIHVAAIINNTLLKEEMVVKNENLKNLHDSIVDRKRPSDLKEKVKKDIGHLEKMLVDIPKKTDAMIYYHAKHIAFAMISHIVIPLTLFLGLYLIAKKIFLPIVFQSRSEIRARFIEAQKSYDNLTEEDREEIEKIEQNITEKPFADNTTNTGQQNGTRNTKAIYHR